MYLYGASGHAKVIIEILQSKGIDVDGLIDDNPNIQYLMDLPVSNKLPLVNQLDMIISIGNNHIRKKVSEEITASYITAVHKQAILSPSSHLGKGSVMMAGAIVNASTLIGDHCIINTNASVDHDCHIDNFVHISPGVSICGGVSIGEGAHIGAGVSIIPGVKIGKWAVVGAGATVTQDIPDRVVAVGVPAKVIKDCI